MSTLSADIAPIFAAVLAVCDQQGLIGREMFATKQRQATEQCVEAAERDTRG